MAKKKETKLYFNEKMRGNGAPIYFNDEMRGVNPEGSSYGKDSLVETDRRNREKAIQEGQKQARLKAIEIARSNSTEANAGNDRTTATPIDGIVNYVKSNPAQAILGVGAAAASATLQNTTIGKTLSLANKAAQYRDKFSDFISKGQKGETTEELLAAAENRVNQYDSQTKDLMQQYTTAKEKAKQYNTRDFAYESQKIGKEISDLESQLQSRGISVEDAEQYIKDVNRLNNAQIEKERNEKISEEIKSGDWKTQAKYDVQDVASSLVSGYPAVASGIKARITGEDVDTNTKAWSLVNRNRDIEQAQRDIITESVDKAVGKKNSFAGKAATYGYDIGMSTAKSVTGMAVGGLFGKVGQAAGLSTEATARLSDLTTLPIYGTNAAAEAIIEGQKRGLNPDQIILTAAAAGFTEMFFEKKSLDHAWEIVRDSSPALRRSKLINYLAQGGIEAYEEGATSWYNRIADYLINGELSQTKQEYDYYIQNGYSEKEALFEVAKNAGISLALDALAGFISGEAGGLVYTGANVHANTKAGRNLANDTEFTNEMLNNPGSKYYIPETNEAYTSEAEYKNAQNLRKQISEASEKVANNQKLKGKEARSLYENVSDYLRVKDQVTTNKKEKNLKPEEEKYNTAKKSYEEVKEDIEFASTPYQLAKAIESVTEETDELKELIEYKREELKTYNFTDEEIDNAVTPKKAFEMGQRGEEVTEEQLNAIPVSDRQEVLEQNNRQYNKSILAENPNAVSDTSTGKYFVPESVKTDGEHVVIVDTEGNEHTEFNSPAIKAAQNAYIVVSKDYNTGKNTDQNLYNVTVEQAALATELAINSKEAKTIQIKSAVQAIFTKASMGTTTFDEFAKKNGYMFDVIDKAFAEKLYNNIRDAARKSDRVKLKNTEGKRTSSEVVSKTLKENLDEPTIALLEAFGSKIGYNFVASSNQDSRGNILPSKRQISIGTNNISELYAIKSHEGIAEYLQAHGNEDEVLEIQDIMLSYLENKMGSREYNNLVDAYQSAYRTGAKSDIDKNKSRRAAANEMFGDTVWTLFASEKGLNDFVNWVTENNSPSEQVSIFTKIKEFFNDILEAIRNYIDSGSLSKVEKAALEMDEKTAQDLRDKIFKAMDHAIENAKASDSNVEESEIRYSKKHRIIEKKEYVPTEKTLKDNVSEIINKGIISESNESFPFNEKGLIKEEVFDYFDSIGGKAINPLIGVVRLSHAGVKHSINRGIYQNKVIGFRTMKDVIEKGSIVDYQVNWKQRGYDTYIIAGLVKINGNECIQGVVIKDVPSETVMLFDIQEVITLSATELKNADAPNTKTGAFTQGETVAVQDASALIDKLIYYANIVNNTKALNVDNSDEKTVTDIQNDVRNSFAGIGAETADMHQLNIASDMMDEGIDEETILASTGWFKGLDNKWKFEIPDNDLVIFKDGNAKFLYGNPDFKRYNELMDKIFYKGDSYTEEEYEELGELEEKVLLKTQDYGNLADFIKHDKLFDAYPFLYGTYVDFVDFKDESIKGAADIKNNGIHLNENFHKSVSGSFSEGAMKSTLLHEIQHLIQQFEDFANGASPAWWADIKQERIEADEKNLVGAKEYLNRAIEDARQRGLPTSVEDHIFDLSEQLESNVITLDEYRKEIAKFKKSKVYHYTDMVRKLERHLRKLRNDSNELLYWNTAGEIEARDVQTRMSLTEQERKEQMPKNYDSDVVYTEGSTAQRRYSIKVDTEGRELSEGQKEYFKDSKVVDEEGRLRVVYHGTMADFTIFDLKEARDTEDIEAFFFSGDVEEAEGYGNLGEYYLNITNPADYKTAYDIFFKYKGKEHTGKLAREELQSMGYDGVIAVDEDSPEYTEYLAFDSNQIKRIDNLNPTENNDIRYSIAVDEDRIYNYRGIEIVQNPTNKEYQQMRADIIKERPWMDGPDTILLRHTYDEDGNEYYWDAYSGMHADIEPAIAEHWKTRVNQQWNWWKDDDKEFWANRSFANRVRNSIKVYGEASPYAGSINESKVIQTIIGTMNNSLSKADAFDISNDELIRIENYLANKYKAELEPGEIAANIAYAFAHMQQNKLDTDYESMMNYLLNIGDEIIKNSKMVDPESQQLYDQARATVASHKFKLSDEERAEISSAFGGSWKAAFGAMQKAGIKLDNKNGQSIDAVFSEIRDEILKAAGVDMSYADKPSQQILSIIDTLTALEPTPYLWDGANDMDKALTVVSDIVDQYYSVATEQLEKNIAKGTAKGNEKIKKAIETEKAKLRGQWAKYKTEKAEEFNSIVAEKNQIIQQQQNQIKQQQEQLKQWDKDAKESTRQNILNEKQMRATAKLQAQQAVQNYKEREERARQIENIKKTGIRLIKWLDNPTEKQHIPIFLQKPLGEFLAAIDFLPTNAKADSKSTLTWQQRMQDLRDVLLKIKEAEADGDNSPEAYFAQNMLAKDLLNMMDEFLGKETWDEFTQSYIVTKRAAKKVSLLDAKELATLNNIMSALSASINNMNKTLANQFYSDMDALAADSFKELKELKKNKNKLNLLAHYLKNFAISEKTPVYFFEELGKGAKSVFDELRQGWNIRTEHIRDASEHMQQFKKENGIDDKDISKWSTHLNTFDLSEGTIELSDAQIMSLYRTVNRAQGRPHVMLGGIRPSDTKLKTKYLHYSKALHINYGDYLKIISVLSDKQILMADEMTRYMSKECSKWGNRTFEKMFGYRKFTEDDYFPLKTDAYSRGVTNASDNNVAYNTLKNGSATKNIVPNANNAVMLDDIFDVFASHVDFMASYDGFVMPIADAMRWFNYSQKVMTGTEEGTRVDVVANMQEALDSVLGEAGNKYFRTFIKNINGIYEGKGGGIELLDMIASNYKAQAVMANLRVVAQQPMAIARATDRIEDRYILQAVALPAATLGIAANKWAKKAQKNSSLAYWKAQGYYETMIGQSLKSIITGDQSFKDKVNELGGFLAGKADDITWGVIYRAAELKVSKTRPDLEYDSQEYTKEVVKVFEDIIDHTQVIDTIFHKSQVMRSANPVAKMATSFMAEPTLTANIAAHRVWEAQQAFNAGDKKKAAKIIGKLLRVLITNSLMVSLAQSLFDALRDDDVDKDFLEKMLYYEFGLSEEMSAKDVVLSNFVDNLNPLNWIPVAKEIMSYIQGYDASNMYVDGIYSALDTISELAKIPTGKSTKTLYGDIYTVAKGLSQLSGMPISNAVREIRTLHNNINNLWGGKDWYTTQAAEKKLEKKIELNRVSEVFDSMDINSMKNEVDILYEDSIAAGKTEAETWDYIRNDVLKSQFKRQAEGLNKNELTTLINRYVPVVAKTKEKERNKESYKFITQEEARKKSNKWVE